MGQIHLGRVDDVNLTAQDLLLIYLSYLYPAKSFKYLQNAKQPFFGRRDRHLGRPSKSTIKMSTSARRRLMRDFKVSSFRGAFPQSLFLPHLQILPGRSES